MTSVDNPGTRALYDQLIPYRWPHGKRCALVISIDVDEESPFLWRMRGKPIRNVAELEMRRFGIRVGIPRILNLLSHHQIHGSFFVPGAVASSNPGLLSTLLMHGHEVGLHGYFHEPVAELTAGANAAVLEQSLQVFREQTGKTPKGYRSPCWQYTEEMPSLLRCHGIEYDSSMMGYDHPYTFEGITEIPVSWDTDDAVSMLFVGNGDDTSAPWPVAKVMEHWLDQWHAAWSNGTLMMITLHPWVFGSAARIEMLDRFLELALGPDLNADGQVWCATAQEIADYHRSSSNRETFAVSMDIPPTPTPPIRVLTEALK